MKVRYFKVTIAQFLDFFHDRNGGRLLYNVSGWPPMVKTEFDMLDFFLPLFYCSRYHRQL